MQKFLILLAVIALALGSFSDEATLVSFALTLADGKPIYLTLLYTLSMIGGVVASKNGSWILPKFSEKILLPTIFALQAVTIFAFYFLSGVWAILVLSFLLGFLGSLLWTVFLAILPLYFAEKISLVNKLAHTIRNAGFVFAPALTGWVFGTIGKNLVLILAGISFICMLILLFISMTKRNPNTSLFEPNEETEIYQHISYRSFITHPTIKKILSFFSVTIALTSALNILLIPYINHSLKLSPFIYGTTLSMMSVGLLISPIMFSSLFGKIGKVSGAYLGAVLMGIGMLGFGLVGMVQPNLVALLLWLSGLLIGIGNGIQNTLMSAFMLEFCGDYSKQIMPHYILTLQTCVLIGFGLTLIISETLILPILWLFGIIVLLCGLMGALINRHPSDTVWQS